jgi:Tol biopolymer transport system component
MHRIVGTTATLVLTASLAAVLTACSGSDRPTADPRTARTADDSDNAQVVTPCDPLPDLPQGRIVYTQTRADGTDAVFLMKPDGTDRRCLVDTAGPDSYPAWSPDGRWLAFIGGAVEGENDVYVVRADGTRLRQLTDSEAIETTPEWSPDGARISYTSEDGVDGPSTIHVMSRDGTDDYVAVGQSADVGHPELHDWSRDSENLLIGAYEGRTGLWTVRVDGTHRRFLHGGPGDYGSGAVYSPDGRSLVFQADVDGGCIYKSDAAVRHVVRLTQGCVEGLALSWSPDGKWIVWSGGSPTDAYVMAADGSQVHTIADHSDVASVDWQPATTS